MVVGDPRGTATPAPADRSDLVRWYRESARTLIDVLVGTPVDATAWTFGSEQVAGFWRRRQAHETVMHLYDALASQGRESEWDVAAAVAWDGVDEVAEVFYPRQVRLERIAPLTGTVRLVPTDVDAAPVEIGGGEPVGTVTGPAAYLLRALWKRTPVDELDDPVAAALLRTAITP